MERVCQPTIGQLDDIQWHAPLEEPVRVAIARGARRDHHARSRLEEPQRPHGPCVIAVSPNDGRLMDEIAPAAAAMPARDHTHIRITSASSRDDVSDELIERVDPVKRRPHPSASPEAQLDERVTRG